MPVDSLDNLLKKKGGTKESLCKKLSINNGKPLLGVVLDKKLSLSDEKVLRSILEGVSHIDINIVVLTDTNVFDDKKVKHMSYDRRGRRELLEASDISLSFPFSDVQEILLNGTVPISPPRPEILDYNPNKETGNGFVYEESDCWCMFAAIVRALETFKFPHDWKNIVRQGLSSVSIQDA